MGSNTLWAIFRTFYSEGPSIQHSLAAVEIECLGPEDQLLAFHDLRDQGRLSEWFDAKALKLVMPLLDLQAMLHPSQTIPSQTSAPGWTKPGLGPSCDYCIDSAVKAGTHVIVELASDMWVCLCFFKDKGRTVVADFDGESYSKGEELHAMRPLRDYRTINSAVIKGIPAQWVEHGPTVEHIRSLFPKGCIGFICYDSESAYHSAMIHPDSRKLCVSKYKTAKGDTRYVMAVGCDQGLGASALFFPVWVRYGYSHFFGNSWEIGPYWADFVDDGIIFCMSQRDADLKRDLMDFSKVKMGLKRSPKQPLDFVTEALFAGLIWTVKGLTLSNEAVLYILSVMKLKPKGVRQARTLRGVIVQAKSAFVFSPQELVKFGQLVGDISDVITECDKSGKWCWTDEADTAVSQLYERLKNAERVYTNPDDLLREGYCLAILGDADPQAIVCSLWLLPVNDANDVTPEDFYGADARLLGMHPKSLNSSQQNWHISEKELLAIVYAIQRFGEMIDRVVSAWFLTQNPDECKWVRGQLIPPVAKIAICSDSKAALGMLLRLSAPSGRVEHVTPKITRFLTYIDVCACTLFWPLARMHIMGGGSGPCNSLCDYICRLVGQLKRPRASSAAPAARSVAG